MADDAGAFTEQLRDGGIGLQAPGADVVEVERRFWSEMLIFVGPVFLTAWGGIALVALTHGGTQVGMFMGVFWLAVVVGSLWQPYVAILRPGGSLTFKALTRTIETDADAIHRISIRAGNRGGGSYIFHFDGRSAALQPFGGRSLALYLLDRDPTIQAPNSLRRRRT